MADRSLPPRKSSVTDERIEHAARALQQSVRLRSIRPEPWESLTTGRKANWIRWARTVLEADQARSTR